MSVSQAELPDTARIWVYGAGRSLSEGESETLRGDLLEFIDQWTAHGAMLKASVELVENRFAVVAVDEAAASASGCSIDVMVRRLADLGRRLGCSLLDGALVFYRTEGGAVEGWGSRRLWTPCGATISHGAAQSHLEVATARCGALSPGDEEEKKANNAN